MKSIKKKANASKAAIAVGCLAMTLASSANAVEGWATDKLRYVYPLANGSFVIALASNPTNCPATGNPKYFYVSAGENGVTVDGVKAMLASVLAAMAMEKNVQIAFDDSTPYCYVNRLVVVN